MIDDSVIPPHHASISTPATEARSLPRSTPSAVAAFLAGGSWGWLPFLSFLGAVGLVLVAIADTAARNSADWAQALFWAGLLIVYAPITARLSVSSIARYESMGLVAILGLELYLVKILHSPLAFTHHDELAHWRTVENILASGHLFGENPILPASSVFPGLESATTALMHVSGLPLFEAGLLVIGVARLALTLALYLFFEQVGGSHWGAGIATALYMGNPNFLFFNAMFKYESLALAFAALALFALVRRARVNAVQRAGLTGLAVLVLAALVVTHHLTSYLLTAFLALWTIVGLLRNHGKPERTGSGWITLVLLAANLAWLFLVARITIPYLAPVLGNAISGAAHLLAGQHSAGRALFQSSTGAVSPLWERATALASVGLIVLGLPLGLWHVWQRYRSSSIVVTLALCTLAYPFTLLLRLTPTGWETSNRSSEFLFVAIGLVLALGASRLAMPHWPRWRGTLAITVCLSIIFAGGVIEGWPPLWRLPGPYIPAQDTRSIEPQGIAAATWTRLYLGPHNLIGADRVNGMLMGTYGDQDVRTNLSGGIDPNWLLYAPRLEADTLRLLREGRLRYLVVDRRLVGAPQVARPYYAHLAIAPALAKFDLLANVSRIFDSGDIRIYNVGELSGNP